MDTTQTTYRAQFKPPGLDFEGIEGNEEAKEAIDTAVRLGGSVLLVGPRETGKSTLLAAVQLQCRTTRAHSRRAQVVDGLGGLSLPAQRAAVQAAQKQGIACICAVEDLANTDALMFERIVWTCGQQDQVHTTAGHFLQLIRERQGRALRRHEAEAEFYFVAVERARVRAEAMLRVQLDRMEKHIQAHYTGNVCIAPAEPRHLRVGSIVAVWDMGAWQDVGVVEGVGDGHYHIRFGYTERAGVPVWVKLKEELNGRPLCMIGVHRLGLTEDPQPAA